MMDKLGDLLRYRAKAMLIGLLVLGVGLISYKFIAAFFDRNQHSWETNLHVNVAELVVLADQKVAETKMRVDLDCGAFSLSGSAETPGCADSKKAYDDALKHKAEVESKRSVVLSQAGQTKSYYDGVGQSARQDPLPYIFTGMGLIVLAVILFLLLPLIKKAVEKKRGGGSCPDGLR